MNEEPQKQVTITPTRGMVIAIAIVIGVGLLGERREAERMAEGVHGGSVFGTWFAPDIDPLRGNPIKCPELGIAIDPLDDFRFYRLDRPDDGREAPVISFINRKALVVGRIETFRPQTDLWPPAADRFGYPPAGSTDPSPMHLRESRTGQTMPEQTMPEQTMPEQTMPEQTMPEQTMPGATEDRSLTVDLLTVSRPRIQVQTIRYPHATVVWASPRKSSAWPLRVHLGKCQMGRQTLLLSLYELNATRPEIDYSGGIAAEVATALHPL